MTKDSIKEVTSRDCMGQTLLKGDYVLIPCKITDVGIGQDRDFIKVKAIIKGRVKTELFIFPEKVFKPDKAILPPEITFEDGSGI